MRWAVVLFGLVWVTGRAAAEEAVFEFVPVRSDRAVVEVDVGDRAPRPVSRLLYGKFTEHLGRNIYLGMWAQLLVNPGFEGAELWGQRAERIRRELAWQLETPRLATSPLPPGWLASTADGVSCRTTGSARTGRQSIQLHVEPGAPAVSLWQPVFLPLHRQRAYRWSMWARTDSGGKLSVRLALPSGGRIYAEDCRDIGSKTWKKYEGELELPSGGGASGPCRFEIRWAGPGNVWVDQCFLFPADHMDGWDPDVVRLVRESRLPLLRWPGGNFASGYHWKDGIGPIDDRPVRVNRPWNMPEPNHVGTDEFMRFCQLVGAEPMICVNAGDGTAEEAAEWVEYCNGPVTSPMGRLRAANGHPEPYGVRYWEVGNELYGRWQIGHCTPEEYAERYRRFAEAMRRRDPTIRLIANGHDRAWNQVLIDRCADILERLSVHTLIGGGISPQSDPERVWWLVVGYPWAYRQHLRSLAEPLRRRVPGGTLAITELQIFTNRPNLPNNGGLAEALFWAGIVHTAVRAGDEVELITHSALVNHGGGLRKWQQRVFGNPVYWARRMYSTQPGRWPVRVRLEGPAFSAPRLHNLPELQDAPVLDVLALAGDDRRQLVLLVINRHARKPLPTSFRFAGFAAVPEAPWQCVTGESILDANTLEEPERVSIRRRKIAVGRRSLELVVPPRSVSAITLTRAG